MKKLYIQLLSFYDMMQISNFGLCTNIWRSSICSKLSKLIKNIYRERKPCKNWFKMTMILNFPTFIFSNRQIQRIAKPSLHTNFYWYLINILTTRNITDFFILMLYC